MTGWHRGETRAGVPFRVPALSGREAREVARRVRSAALEARDRLSPEEVIREVGRTASRLADPETPVGRRAEGLLRAELGWPTGAIRHTLNGMREIWTPEALRRLVDAELGGTAPLRGFTVAGTGRDRRAAGPPLLLVVQAANVPGVAVTAVLRGLLVRSGVLSKTGLGEPGLTALFARTLAETCPLLGRSVAVTWWPGGVEDAAGDEWGKQAGKVVLYGGEEAASALRRRLPAATPLELYGPRLGLAVVLPDAGAREAARALAADALAYRGLGCVSPRIVYLVGLETDVFVPLLARSLAREAARIPQPRPTPAEAVALRRLRAEKEFGGLAGGKVRVVGDDADLSWTILVGGDPAPESHGLPGVVWLHALRSTAELKPLLRPLEGRIQALGYAGRKGLGGLARLCVELGVSRLAPLGTVAWPPVDWRHDGRHQLLPLLRWTDWEHLPAEAALGEGGRPSGEEGRPSGEEGGRGAEATAEKGREVGPGAAPPAD